MSDGLIPSILVPAGINDERNKAFIAAFSQALQEFVPQRLVVQDAATVDSRLLPILVVEAGLSDFVSPNMREDLLRAMISVAPEIHAQTGTIKGVRRALAALGIRARWTQWWQQTPQGPHDTHKVVLFLADTVIDGHAPLDVENQRAAARVIAVTKRHSQDIAIQYGVSAEASLFAGADLRRGRTVRIRAPHLGDEHYSISSFVGTGAYALRSIRINAKAA